MRVFGREVKTHLLHYKFSTRSYPMFVRENGHGPDPEREVTDSFHDRVTHITDENCNRRNG
jgi:hypothetical protein